MLREVGKPGVPWCIEKGEKKKKNFEESGNAGLNIFHEARKPMFTKTHTHTTREV